MNAVLAKCVKVFITFSLRMCRTSFKECDRVAECMNMFIILLSMTEKWSPIMDCLYSYSVRFLSLILHTITLQTPDYSYNFSGDTLHIVHIPSGPNGHVTRQLQSTKFLLRHTFVAEVISTQSLSVYLSFTHFVLHACIPIQTNPLTQLPSHSVSHLTTTLYIAVCYVPVRMHASVVPKSECRDSCIYTCSNPQELFMCES